MDKWIKNVEKLKSDFDWEKRSELTKFIFFIVVWLLIVMTCGMLGEVFPSSQPKYEVWKEEQLVLCFWDEKFYAYDIIISENGKMKIEIEDGKGHSCFGYPHNGLMVVSGESLVYQEKFHEIFKVLCDFYSENTNEKG